MFEISQAVTLLIYVARGPAEGWMLVRQSWSQPAEARVQVSEFWRAGRRKLISRGA